MEWYLIYEILIDINQCAYHRDFIWNLFPIVSTTISQEIQMYTNRHNHEHNIKPNFLFHVVHIYNI